MTHWGDPDVVVQALGAGATFLAVLAAVAIAVRSERKASQRAAEDRKSYAEAARLDAKRDRQDAWRARMHDLLFRLLDVVQTDSTRVAGTVQPSIQGRVLCQALYNERNWIGCAWDVYVEGSGRWQDPGAAEFYRAMTQEIADAIASLDSEERVANDLE